MSDVDVFREAVASMEAVEVAEVEIVDVVDLGDSAGVGDGMCSSVKSYSVDFVVSGKAKKRTHLVVKRPKEENDSSASASAKKTENWWRRMRLFDRELEFYSKAMFEIERIIGEKVAPGVYHAAEDLLVMEDLKRGVGAFRMAQETDPDLRVSLTEEQARLALTKLARFHAASRKFVLTYPGGLDALRGEMPLVAEAGTLGMFVTTDEQVRFERWEMYYEMTKQMVPTLRAELEDATIADRFEANLKGMAETCGKSRNPTGHPFLILAHGDFWSNNILFGTAASASAEVRFLDFQESMLSRPSTDVACLLLTSLSPQLRKSKTEDFLSHYHAELTENLRLLGLNEEVYTLRQLEDDCRSGAGHGFYWGIIYSWGRASSGDLSELLTGKKEEGPDIPTTLSSSSSPWVTRVISLVEEAAELGIF